MRAAKRSHGRPPTLQAIRVAQARADQASLDAGVAETIALSEARGDQFTARKGAASGPRRKKDGLDWLSDKGRITPRQRAAGDKYGTDWRRSQPPGMRSCLDDTVRGYSDSPLEAQAQARALLERTRRGAFNGNPALAEACDVVCGAGLKPIEWAGGDDRLAGRYEERVQRALELLEGYYFE